MFVWKKEFELGIELIDGQHKQLLEIGNRISSLVAAHDDESDNYDDIMAVIGELKDYTVYHFTTEENLFRECNYLDSKNHKKEHDDFIAYINSVDFESIDVDQKGFLKDLLKKLINWVFNHIITTDFLYKDCLVSCGVK